MGRGRDYLLFFCLGFLGGFFFTAMVCQYTLHTYTSLSHAWKQQVDSDIRCLGMRERIDRAASRVEAMSCVST